MVAIAELLEVSRMPDGVGSNRNASVSNAPVANRSELHRGASRPEFSAGTVCSDCIAGFERGCGNLDVNLGALGNVSYLLRGDTCRSGFSESSHISTLMHL